MKALGIAATGMNAQQTNVDVIANNIANAQTTGYKAGRAVFQDLIYQSMRREGAATSADGTSTPVGIDIGLGARAAGIVRNNEQGGLVETGNDLDMAIDGRGFFVINRPDGTVAYSRDGNFGLSPEGEIISMDGYPLDPGIVVPENTTEIEISQTGLVTAYVSGEAEPQEIGQLTLATFVNEAGLKAVGQNLFLESGASGEPILAEPGTDGSGLIRQKYVEGSNVDSIKQITDLIKAQRSYEMNSKVMTTADQMLQTANQVR
ncbi:flagellar basal-body rod protein FlgG [Paracoccus litorisediminis]|uniref:flagellar basal-body rod protein FlgG n=1 Tax=Paracoccus litorisediminis TaxID=2006130 RepID=UPI003730C0F4